ncbi:MAG: hypothetical protein RLZZ505_2909 [Verrucomicrobiota bacterium]|jgi:hypothetical protein
MRSFSFPALLLCLAICSCKDKEISTHRVAVETEAPPKEDAGGHDHAAHSDSVTWRALPDWKMEKTGKFLAAAYAVPELGRLTVSKLGGDGGGLAANVNRWRGQAKMQPLPESDIHGQPMPVKGSSREMLLFNLNPDDAPAEAEGIFAAVLPLDSETWFFKLTGPSGKLREKGGEVFMAFLSEVRIAGENEATPASPTPDKVPEIQVTAPEGWQESEGSSMRVASFAVKGKGGATADISVIPLPGESGSVMENVNRWRGQLELPPLAAADDPALGVEMDGAAGKLFVTHMVSEEPVLDGKKAAISTAILKAEGVTWFFKITGEASLVEANREKFVNFARTADFP